MKNLLRRLRLGATPSTGGPDKIALAPTRQSVDGVFYAEAGSEYRGQGQGYVFLHGLGGSRHQWIRVQRELASSSWSIAVDIPGFGESRSGRPRFDIAAASEQIVQLCNSLDIRDSVLVSHSIGSAVAGLLASEAASRFNRVILVSGTLFRVSAIAQKPMRAFRNPNLGLAVAAQFAAGVLPLTAYARRSVVRSPSLRKMTLWPFVADPMTLDPELLGSALEGVGSPAVLGVLLSASRIDYDGIIAAIPQPVYLIWGDKDRLIAIEDLERTRRSATVARELMIEDCGHWPMIECPDRVVAAIKSWE